MHSRTHVYRRFAGTALMCIENTVRDAFNIRDNLEISFYDAEGSPVQLQSRQYDLSTVLFVVAVAQRVNEINIHSIAPVAAANFWIDSEDQESQVQNMRHAYRDRSTDRNTCIHAYSRVRNG
jgi:hypothetical protein